MSKNTKRKIRQIGIFLFIVYVMLLSYVLFFSEAYGRMAAEESIYRYNLKPFAEIRRFWVYRSQVGLSAFFLNVFGNEIGRASCRERVLRAV